jgi:hypothetical protein
VETFNLIVEDMCITVKGQLFNYGKKPYGVKAKGKVYLSEENNEFEVTHINQNKTGICYWLKSYGLHSWMIEGELCLI